MQASHLPKHNSEKTPFDMICQAAQKQNREELIQVLSLASINVYRGKNTCTPIIKLAAEKDMKAVSFLIKFDASLSYGAAQGFALGGHTTEAYAVLDKARDGQVAKTISSMAHGFALGGHTTEAYAALEKAKSMGFSGYPIHLIVDNMVSGFAQGGHTTAAYAAVERARIERRWYYPDHNRYPLDDMAHSLALGGHTTAAYAFLDKVKKEYPDQITYVLANIASGLAQGGHTTAAYAFLDKVKKEHPDQIALVLINMTNSFIRGAHKAIAWAFLEKVKKEHPDQIPLVLDHMANSFVRYTHKMEAYALLEKVKNEYPDQIALVLKCIANTESRQDECTDKVVVLKALTRIKNPNERHALALELKTPIIDDSYDVLSLVPQAEKLNKIMKDHKINDNQLWGYIQPEMPIFLLQGITLVHRGKLPSSLFLVVATFLCPITLYETHDFLTKFPTRTDQARFFRNLKDQGVLSLAPPLKQNESKEERHTNNVNVR